MRDYSFKSTILLVNGIEISGPDEGDDVIKVARLNDSANHKVGADGEMVVSISADRSGEVTFRLLGTTGSNKYLYGLVAAADNGAFVPVAVMFKDLKGGQLGGGSQGYIKRPADMTFGVNEGSRTWSIIVERLDMLDEDIT